MFRKLLVCTVLAAPAFSFAADKNVDDVLKRSDAVTEQQLDEAAEQLVSQEINKKTESTAAATATASVTEAKVLPESEIPVLTSEKTKKAEPSSPWFRLFGGAMAMITAAIVLVFGVKKYSKKSAIGGKRAKIEMLHQHFLGPKKSVALIQVAGEAILIGVTDHNISMLKSVALIDDEMMGESNDFNGFLDEEFTMETLTAQKSKARLI